MNEHLRIRYVDIDEDIYMILENKIPHLIPLTIQYYNEEYTYDYHLQGKESLVTFVKQSLLSEVQIKGLLKNLVALLEVCEEYLLDAYRICVVPKYIYYDKEDDSWFFLYLPGKGIDLEKSIFSLLSYLLKWVDYSNEKMVKQLYQLYQSCHQEEKKLSEYLIGFLQTEPEVEEIDYRSPYVTTYFYEEEKNTNEAEAPVDRFQEKSRLKESIVVISVISIFLGVLFVAYQFLRMSPIKIGACLLFGLLSFGAYFTIGRKKKNTNSTHFDKGRGTCWETMNTMYLDMSKEGTTIWSLYEERSCEKIPLPEGNTTIGRKGKGANITIEDKSISAFHCLIYIDKTNVEIVDLDSRNGTYVNGKKINKIPVNLKHSDVIQLGNKEYRFLKEISS